MAGSHVTCTPACPLPSFSARKAMVFCARADLTHARTRTRAPSSDGAALLAAAAAVEVAGSDPGAGAEVDAEAEAAEPAAVSAGAVMSAHETMRAGAAVADERARRRHTTAAGRLSETRLGDR